MTSETPYTSNGAVESRYDESGTPIWTDPDVPVERADDRTLEEEAGEIDD
ncbi:MULTISPECIES: hypothetical protein [Natrialbaceae]|nr:hypothetical protein [Natronococcus sp. CG52]